MTITALIVGSAFIGAAFLTKFWFLAPTRLGGLFYYTNILLDWAWKRLRISRGVSAGTVFVSGCGILYFAGIPWLVLACLVVLLLLFDIFTNSSERRTLSTVYVHAEAIDSDSPVATGTTPGSLPRPSVHPDLVVSLMGPFVRRTPRYDLGRVAYGRILELEVIVANHSLIACQLPIEVCLRMPPDLRRLTATKAKIDRLGSGDFARIPLRIQAVGPGTGDFTVTVRKGEQAVGLRVGYSTSLEPGALASAAVERYPGACATGFAWRGDMDLYDDLTSQSIEGLTHTLKLAARYCFPQTMFLSTRLCLDASEVQQYYSHFGVSRGESRIPDFIDWLRNSVEIRHRISYPFRFSKPFALELGNHMHLHYGTDAAASLENQWTLMARMGVGRYSWMGDEEGSFAEQRDNARKARSMMEEHLGYSPKSWAMPDSTNDQWTPAAVEAAGCDVLSDSDATHEQNVLFQPPPHHPRGTKAVELTKRYPGDPQDFTHYSMFLYWLHRGHRKRIPVVFMCHQHLRLYQGHACTRFTEAVMRYALTRFNGDFHINTVYGIGIFWRDVLSPETRKVKVDCSGSRIRVFNRGSLDFEGVPVDLQYSDGRKATVLVDLPAGSEIEIDPVTQSSKVLSGTPHGNPAVPA